VFLLAFRSFLPILFGRNRSLRGKNFLIHTWNSQRLHRHLKTLPGQSLQTRTNLGIKVLLHHVALCGDLRGGIRLILPLNLTLYLTKLQTRQLLSRRQHRLEAGKLHRLFGGTCVGGIAGRLLSLSIKLISSLVYRRA